MTYSAKAVANWFIDRAVRQQSDLTLPRLQKLIFMAHGWSLALLDRPLVRDGFQDLEDGVGIPSLTCEFGRKSGQPIRRKAVESCFDRHTRTVRSYEPAIDQMSPELQAVLENVWRSYGHLSNLELAQALLAVPEPDDSVFASSGARAQVHAPPGTAEINRHFALADTAAVAGQGHVAP